MRRVTTNVLRLASVPVGVVIGLWTASLSVHRLLAAIRRAEHPLLPLRFDCQHSRRGNASSLVSVLPWCWFSPPKPWRDCVPQAEARPLALLPLGDACLAKSPMTAVGGHIPPGMAQASID